jgi:hypothetical protein
MTNAEMIKSMTPEELAGFLFNVEFIRKLAYPKGKTFGSFSVLKEWLEQEATTDLKNRWGIIETQNKERHEELGISEDEVKNFYKNINS